MNVESKSMTHTQRKNALTKLSWNVETDPQTGDPLQHKICTETCYWITGKIDCVEWNAWISEVSGMVYLHTSPEIDKPFDGFCELVRDGWPKAKVAPVSRGLFDDDTD